MEGFFWYFVSGGTVDAFGFYEDHWVVVFDRVQE